jgi:rhamnogalacturonyl hydrolase YesR
VTVGRDARIDAAVFAQEMSHATQNADDRFDCVYQDEGGRVLLHQEANSEPCTTRRSPTSVEAMRAACAFLMNAAAASEGTPFPNTVLTCYDVTNRSYRLLSWRWTTGVAIQALLIARQNTWIDERGAARAQALSDQLLASMITHGQHAGAFTARWDIGCDTPHGIVPWLAPNDVAFAAAHGLAPAYESTGDPRYLDAALLTGRWLLSECWGSENRFRVGFRQDTEVWVDDWYYVDGGIATALFNELSRITGEARWAEGMRRFMVDFMGRMYLGDGLFRKTWVKSGRRPETTFTRGYAWALDALLNAWECLGDPVYLSRAQEVARVLRRHQQPDGSWPYELGRQSSGACNKATPIIGYHLARLAQHDADRDHEQCARAAAEWCRDAIRVAPERPEHGGIVAWNEEGAISTRRSVSTAFSYSSAYYILLVDRLTHLHDRTTSAWPS